MKGLIDLVRQQRPGYSLEQPFYVSDEIYAEERGDWLARQWYVVAHVSEVQKPGSYIVRELLGESILIVRASDGTLRAFFNVCRHRGARLCEQDGASSTLVCPYHAWSYRLDGSLRAAAALPPTINTAELSLRPICVRDIGGLIIASLGGNTDDLDFVGQIFTPGLQYHGVPTARIAARRRYPTRANWKLVMENFAECYHCAPCHPEYCGVMREVDYLAHQSPAAAAEWKAKTQQWLREQANLESPLGTGAPSGPAAARNGGLIVSAKRAPIGGQHLTQSRDGKPVSTLMGHQPRFDGGMSSFVLLPFVFLVALNDHAVLFQFAPESATSTSVTLTWLVDGNAKESDVDLDRLVWLWDVTTLQDKAIVEKNAQGVQSRAYTPGPYTLLEERPAWMIGRYLEELAAKHG